MQALYWGVWCIFFLNDLWSITNLVQLSGLSFLAALAALYLPRWLADSLTHSLTHWLTHSLTHSLVLWPYFSYMRDTDTTAFGFHWWTCFVPQSPFAQICQSLLFVIAFAPWLLSQWEMSQFLSVFQLLLVVVVLLVHQSHPPCQESSMEGIWEEETKLKDLRMT